MINKILAFQKSFNYICKKIIDQIHNGSLKNKIKVKLFNKRLEIDMYSLNKKLCFKTRRREYE